MSIKPNTPTSKKNIKKEEKLKEIKKLCILNNTNLNEDTELNRQKYNERIQFLAKEFLNECKKKLDEKTFENLILKLVLYKSNSNGSTTTSSNDDRESLNQLIDFIYNQISSNNDLKNRLSAFMSCENVLNYDLFLNALQYEKTNDFFQILEVCIESISFELL